MPTGEVVCFIKYKTYKIRTFYVAAKTASEPKRKLIPIIWLYPSRSLNNNTPAIIGITGYAVVPTDAIPTEPSSAPLANRKKPPIFKEDVKSNKPKFLTSNFCHGTSLL